METIYEANELALGLVCFALMLIASEAGFRLGRRSGNHPTKDTKLQHLTVEAGILGVLGLLLGVHHVDGFDALRSVKAACA